MFGLEAAKEIGFYELAIEQRRNDVKPKPLVLLTLSILVVSAPSFAHHGTAAYDVSKTINTKATVTIFDWHNPHCLLYCEIKGDRGQIQHWSIQMYAPLYLARAGWNKDTLKPGDEITISFHPAKNGVPVGYIRDGDKIVLNGQELNLKNITYPSDIGDCRVYT